jgi:Universal stress protein family
MNILCATDASDEGYRALEALVGIIAPNQLGKVTIITVTWPQRESSIWQKAYEQWADKDDLHEAMADTVSQVLERFEQLFRGHADAIETEERTGDPVVAVLESAKSTAAQLIVVAITGEPGAHAAHKALMEVVYQSPVPVVVAYGRGSR